MSLMRKLYVMVRVVNLFKTFRAYNLQKFYKILCTIVLLFIVILICGVVLNNMNREYNSIAPKSSYIKALKRNKECLLFAQKHQFEDSAMIIRNFQNLVNDFAKKYKITVKHNDIQTTNNINGLQIADCETELFCWHDTYIFEMLEKIQHLSPGCVFIHKINIKRISNINFRYPALKVKILCKLYYK